MMYWTDRGLNSAGGNSLNGACIGTDRLPKYEVLATGLQEEMVWLLILPVL
ncbi:hypothetical protein [Snodgrassella alvi]|nr:hypothetical protein [Snodgrassella alvi]